MSVATEFAPIVDIPERARSERERRAARRRAVGLSAVDPLGWSPVMLHGCGNAPVNDLGVSVVTRHSRIGSLRVHGSFDGVVDLSSLRAGTVGQPRAASSPAVYRPSVHIAGRSLRVTARGRVVLALALAAAVGVLFVLAAASRTSEGASSGAIRNGFVTVQTGETLWSIAQRVAPQADPRSVVDVLVQRNHLESSTVVAGQRLEVG